VEKFKHPREGAISELDVGRKVIMKTEYNLKKMKVKRRGILPSFHVKTEDHSKDRITILLDKDVIEYFKSKAKQPGAFPYQTQINQALRNLMTQSNNDSDDIDEIKTTLLNDKNFIKQLAQLIGKSHSK
jgi:uncharacterized protein (DUF4415 family)